MLVRNIATYGTKCGGNCGIVYTIIISRYNNGVILNIRDV